MSSLVLCLFLLVLATIQIGCTQNTNQDDQSTAAPSDPVAAAAANKPLYTEQLELKKTELAQKDLELESAKGMLAMQRVELHPNEELISTYEQRVQQIDEERAELREKIAWLEEAIVHIDQTLNEPVDPQVGAEEMNNTILEGSR
ncbi:MAG: hypothetical protein LBP24_01605 [Coriobacteriales bacterium]|jgi:DNA repair exonuclease SbcCD ATPase subunit|nr:hypothetical protein [Coriobacteriales bacterium]